MAIEPVDEVPSEAHRPHDDDQVQDRVEDFDGSELIVESI
jgi:hypothetical protein